MPVNSVVPLGNDTATYRATDLARDLSDAGFEANPEILSLIARYEDKGVRSGRYLLLTPVDVLRFAEEAASCGVGTLGPNFWHRPGWDTIPSPDYSSLAREPGFVQ